MAIKDTYGRIHDYLRISLTDKCNLRCLYCLPDENTRFFPNSRLMTADEILAIASVFVSLGVKKIRLTGGEPLLRKDAETIIRRLAGLGTELTLTTNGVFVKDFIPVFKEVDIQSVNLSLDTLEAEKFNQLTRRDLHQKVLDNMQLLIDEGFHTKVNVVLMKGQNDTEVNRFVALTERLPIHVRFIEFMPFKGNRWDRSKTVTYKEIIDTVTQDFEIEKLEDHKHDTTRKYKVKEAVGTFAVISTVTAPFCTGCNRIRLTADGKIKNCLFSNEEMDLLALHRAGGDIQSVIYEAFKKKYLYHAGLPAFDAEQAGEAYSQGRSMTAIGG